MNLALHEPWSVSVQVESGRGAEPQASQRKENQRKNRYFDVLPSEESRVILSGAGYPMEDGSDYINASHILVSFRSLDSSVRVLGGNIYFLKFVR